MEQSKGIPLRKKKFLLRDSDRSGFTHRNVELFLDNGNLVAGDEIDAPPPSNKLYPDEGGVSPGDIRANPTDYGAQTHATVQTVGPNEQIHLNHQVDNAGQYTFNKSIIYVEAKPTVELLTNGGFETWTGGSSVAPDGWTLSGASAAVAREGTKIKVGTYSAKLTMAADPAYLLQDIYTVLGGTASIGKTITLGGWVYATNANSAYLRIKDAGSQHLSSEHSGVAGWEYLTVTATIQAGTTTIYCGPLVANAPVSSAYFDSLSILDVRVNPYQIAPSSQGDFATIQGAGSSLILYNGSGLRLYSNVLRLDSGSLVTFIYNATDGLWCETSRMAPNFAQMGRF